MAQSPGDGKLPRTGPRSVTTTQQIPSLGEAYHGSDTYVVGAFTCCGLTNSGPYTISGDG